MKVTACLAVTFDTDEMDGEWLVEAVGSFGRQATGFAMAGHECSISVVPDGPDELVAELEPEPADEDVERGDE